MEAWRLAEAVTLRPEAFGGMAFHRERGVTLEVDAEAYRFLCACLRPRPLPPPDHPAARLAPRLAHLGFICPADVNREQTTPVPDTPWLGDILTLSAPETVHLAITARCNLSCPGCYVPHPGAGAGPELTVAELRGLIAQWAHMRVFQLAVGGGEPLLYEGLFDVLAYARERSIVPNLTTNGTLLDADVIRRLERAGVARVNLSWNDILSRSKDGPDDGARERDRSVTRALRALLDSTLQVGVNLLVTPALLSRLPRTLARLQTLGVRRVTILRPKPPAIFSEAVTAWYSANRLCRADLLRLRAILNSWRGILQLEVDSALVSLMGDADPALLRWRGVHGCVAGRRICTVWPDGRVTPCSFLADLDAGNVRQAPFAELWQRGENWGVLRDPTARLQGSCADCDVALQCGGARCVARRERGDLLAGDAECPRYRGVDPFDAETG
ncbi:MAG: radical SAM protein [Anaerolineae bacterium]|nr:radical SAM protein [Anaerolineae bacterium]